MKYDLNYFYKIVKDYSYEEDYKVFKENGEVLNVTLLYERDFEFRTKDTKVPHFASITIPYVSFNRDFIFFVYENKRVPSAIGYSHIVDVEIETEGTVGDGCEYNFIIELDDGMVIKF